MASVSPFSAEFDRAKNFRLPFGKHKGRTLNEVSVDDDGLLYLDWLAGQEWLLPQSRDPLVDFLTHDAVARDVARLVESRRGRGK